MRTDWLAKNMAVNKKSNTETLTYFSSLDSTSQDRYKEKLQVDGDSLPDPYSASFKGWEDDMKKWPSVEYADIYTYLIDTPGVYTREKLKAGNPLTGTTTSCQDMYKPVGTMPLQRKVVFAS